jgi:hypothetical protein
MAEALTSLCTNIELNKLMGHEARATVETRYADEVAGKVLLHAWHRIMQKTKINANQQA